MVLEKSVYDVAKGEVSMKWRMKGHEFDREAEECVKTFCENEERIYVFGAGLLGNEVSRVLQRIGCFTGYIDNDVHKQRTGVGGIPVISLGEYMRQGAIGWIVIAMDVKYVPQVDEQLAKRGLVKGTKYFIWEEFLRKTLRILMTYHYHQSYVDLAQIVVTERCSLRCQKCAHACAYVDSNAEDMPIETVCKSADAFFSKIDLIRKFVLIGGEPLLYKQLPKAVAYIGERYRDKVIRFCITTNGTIMPNEELMTACRKYRVEFQISNYSLTLPHLTEKYKKLTELLSANNVEFILGEKELDWWDYGFEDGDRRYNEIKLQEVFDLCKTPCREVRGSRYYFCVMARSVSDNMGIGIGEEDYLDLDALPEDYRKVLLEFELGYSEKGYLDMCRHCNGMEAKRIRLPAAKQMMQGERR